MKILLICSLAPVSWESETFKENGSILVFSIFKLKFHQNYRLYLFDQGRREKVSSSREVFERRFLDLCSLNQGLRPKIPRRGIFLIRCNFELVFLSHYKLEFLHHELSPKNKFCRGALRWKTADFVRWIRHLIAKNFQKEPLVNNFSRHSN